MEKVELIFDLSHNLWESRVLENLPLVFPKKVFWWLVDINHSLFDLYDKELLFSSIKDGSFIVVDHSQDPCSLKTIESLYLKELIDEFKLRGLPLSHIIVVTPTPKSLFFGSSTRPYNYASFNSLFEMTKIFIKDTQSSKFEPFKKHPIKHFLCLMRRDSFNRRITNYLLHQKNIHDKGLVSHLRYVEGLDVTKSSLKAEALSLTINNDFDIKKYLTNGLKTHFLSQESLEDKGTAAHSYILHKKLSRDTCFELISETDTSNCLFFTEKTFKAFLNKSPFILLGNHNGLKYLQHLGFHTFHPLIDETYDSIPDFYLRIDSALNQVKLLCDLPLNLCEEKLLKLNSICDHNYSHFINTHWHFGIVDKIGKILCNE
jgi:hypothetical protein